MFFWYVGFLIIIFTIIFIFVKYKINYKKICSKCEHCCAGKNIKPFCWHNHSFVKAEKCLRDGNFKLKTDDTIIEDGKETKEKSINEMIIEEAKFFSPYNYEDELPNDIVNGICIMYDTIENRVVYVGRNDKDNNLVERLSDYFKTGKCSLCRSVNDALTNLNNRFVSKNEAINYLRSNIKFALIKIDEREVRNRLTYCLINTFAFDPNNKRGVDWLGRYSSDKVVSNGNLWNKDVGKMNGNTLSKEDIEICINGLVH